MSRRVIVALASATVLSAVLPGFAGYVTAQFQALDRAREELARLKAQLRMKELTVEPAAAHCRARTSPGRGHQENGMQVPTPPRTNSRPWQDAALNRVEPPTAWSSLVVPARPVPASRHPVGPAGPRCSVAGPYLTQLGFRDSTASSCRER